MNDIRKRGISLTVLLITIIMMIILASTAIIQINVSSDNSRLSVFATNVSQLEENIKAKYIIDHEIPYDTSTTSLTKNDVLSIVDVKKRDLLEMELAQNGESDSSIFYILDVNNLGADKLDTGNKKLGEEDIYIVSANTLKVYYLYGVKYNGTRYFSINNNVEKIVTGGDEQKLNEPQDTSVSQIETYGSVKISKNNAIYTNNMQVKIEATMNASEELRIGFDGVDNRKFNVGSGNVVIEFKSLKDLNSKNILSSNFSDSDISKFNLLKDENRKIYIYKYSNSDVVGTYEIDVSNFDDGIPSITSSSVEKKDTFSLIKGNVSDNNSTICVSGVSQVRYEYLTRTDGNSYYSDITVDDDYMKNKAKKVVLAQDGEFGLKIPLDVAVLEIAAIDGAGNYVSKIIQAADIVEDKDIIPPVIVATGMNEVATKNKDIKITVTDSGGSGLRSDNVYEYQLSTSNTAIPASTWVRYTNNNSFNIGTSLTGTYYLWVREVKDNANNVSVKEGNKLSQCHVFGKYEFDNTPPVVKSIKVISPRSGNYPSGTKIRIEVTFDEEVYSNTNSSTINYSNAPTLSVKIGSGTQIESNFVSAVGKTLTYECVINDGDNGQLEIVSYIGNVHDRLGNRGPVQTKTNSGEIVVADTTKPEVEITPNGGNYVVPTGSNYATLKPVVSVTDNISGVNNSSLQYVWSKEINAPTSGYTSFTNNSEVRTTQATAGTWYLYIKASDNVGNSTIVKSQPFVVVTDRDTNGKIILTPDKTNWTNTDVKVTVSYGSNLTNSKTLTCTGTVNTDYTVSVISYVMVKTNSKTVTATAKDGFGNMVTKTLQISNIDKLNPTVNVSPSSDNNATDTKQITITTGDTGGSGLSSTNIYQFQWSTSSTSAPTGTWTTYASGRQVTQGGTFNGNYYLWVKEIRDNATNVSSTSGTKVTNYHVFGPYAFVPIITVTFNSNGGNTPNPTSKQVIPGKTYGDLASVTASGRNFAGWYTTASGGTKVESTTTVTQTANHTLYAHWEPWVHTIKYDANGGTGAPGDQTKTYGSALTLTTAKPTKTGYTFKSWNTKPDGSGTSYASGGNYNVDQNGGIVTLYAIWKDETPPTCSLAVSGTGCQNINVTADVSDSGSGMQKVVWYIAVNSSNPSYGTGVEQTVTSNTKISHNFTGLNDNTTYIIKAVAYDKAGNTKTTTITGTTILAVCQNAAGVKYAKIQTGFDSNNNTTVTMIRDTTESATLASGKTITYNLNGKTVTGSGNASSKAFAIENCGTMTITGSGNLLSPTAEWCDAVVNTSGTLTLNTTATIKATCYKGNAVYNVSGTIYIRNGTYLATNNGRQGANDGTSIVKQKGGAGSLIEISGGSFVQSLEYSLCVNNASQATGEVRITGGTFKTTSSNTNTIVNGDTSGLASARPIMNISGGTFEAASSAGTTLLVNYGTSNLSGGTFTNTSTGNAAIVSATATLNLSGSVRLTSKSSQGTVYVRRNATFTNAISGDTNITNTADASKKIYRE